VTSHAVPQHRPDGVSLTVTTILLLGKNEGIAISDPGYQPGYTEVTKERNKVFLTEAKPELFYTDAADPIGTWVELEKRIVTAQARSNVCIVPLGTKPHALGGCLAALSTRTPAVLYLMPRGYKRCPAW
jgi:hypothetical protein